MTKPTLPVFQCMRYMVAETFVLFTLSSNVKTNLAGDVERLDDAVLRAAMRAVNKTADRARTASAREIRNQVNFPAQYLNSRLTVTQRAKMNNLEAVVTGRDAPTSLARFAKGQQKPGGYGVRVEVKPGAARFIKTGFLMKLKNNNVGLAIRTEGGPPSKKKGAYKPKKLRDNLWLVYGPAVDQVFRTVADDVSEPMADYLSAEFDRLLDVGDF